MKRNVLGLGLLLAGNANAADPFEGIKSTDEYLVVRNTIPASPLERIGFTTAFNPASILAERTGDGILDRSYLGGLTCQDMADLNSNDTNIRTAASAKVREVRSTTNAIAKKTHDVVEAEALRLGSSNSQSVFLQKYADDLLRDTVYVPNCTSGAVVGQDGEIGDLLTSYTGTTRIGSNVYEYGRGLVVIPMCELGVCSPTVAVPSVPVAPVAPAAPRETPRESNVVWFPRGGDIDNLTTGKFVLGGDYLHRNMELQVMDSTVGLRTQEDVENTPSVYGLLTVPIVGFNSGIRLGLLGEERHSFVGGTLEGQRNQARVLATAGYNVDRFALEGAIGPVFYVQNTSSVDGDFETRIEERGTGLNVLGHLTAGHFLLDANYKNLPLSLKVADASGTVYGEPSVGVSDLEVSGAYRADLENFALLPGATLTSTRVNVTGDGSVPTAWNRQSTISGDLEARLRVSDNFSVAADGSYRLVDNMDYSTTSVSAQKGGPTYTAGLEGTVNW